MPTKNRPGGNPKQKGRLVAALVSAQASAAMRSKAAGAAEDKEQRAKNSAAGETQAQMKKKRKLERAAERVAERAELEVAAARATLALEEGEEAVVVKDAAEGKGKRAREERERRKGTVPYALGEKILLIGEGNFSFAHSLLLLQPPTVTPHLLLATSFDTLEVALDKYPDLMVHVNAVQEMGAKVVFGVDATDLKKCKEVKEGREWDRVAFNFPHVGAGITDQDRNVRSNQTLILRFFRSVGPFLRKGTSGSTTSNNAIKKDARASHWTSKKDSKRARVNSDDEGGSDWTSARPAPEEEEPEEEIAEEDEEINARYAVAPPPPTTSGTVLITLRTTAPYTLWSLGHLGTRGSLIAPSILPRPLPPTAQPNYIILRSFEFSPADYEGYEHRRTVGFKDGVSSGKNEDLNLTARERGEKRREEKESIEKGEKELRQEMGSKNGKERKGAMRTWEFELVKLQDVDDAYD